MSDVTWRSPMGKPLCSSVVIQSRKVSWTNSVTVRVSITSSMNARPRWQFCSSAKPPCQRATASALSQTDWEEDLYRQHAQLRGRSPCLWWFEPARIKPRQARIRPTPAEWLVQSTASSFNRLDQSW